MPSVDDMQDSPSFPDPSSSRTNGQLRAAHPWRFLQKKQHRRTVIASICVVVVLYGAFELLAVVAETMLTRSRMLRWAEPGKAGTGAHASDQHKIQSDPGIELANEAMRQPNPVRRRVMLKKAATKLQEEIKCTGYASLDGENRGLALISVYEGLDEPKLEFLLIENILASEPRDSCLYHTASVMYPQVKNKMSWPITKKYFRKQSRKMRLIVWWFESLFVGKGYSRL